MFENMLQKYITAKNVIFFIIAIMFIRFVGKIEDIAIMFFASFVLACSLEPLVEKLTKFFKRPLASSLVLFIAMLLICIFFIPIIILAAHEIKNFAMSFPQYMDIMKTFISGLPFVDHSIFTKVDIGGMVSSASGVTGHVINETINFGKNIGSGLVYLIGSIIMIYYFMADKDTVHDTFLKLFPTNMRKRADEIIETITKKIGGYVIAQIAAMASVGVIMTIGLLMLRVEYALLLGLITAVLDLIPIVGPAFALVICLVVSYKSGIGVLALIVLVFAVAQFTENNFVRPYIFSKFLDLHPIIIYLFLFIMAKYFGVIGLVFAPAVAATAVVLIQELYMKNIE